MIRICTTGMAQHLRRLIRDTILVLCVGLVGSQLLLAVTGGFPLVQDAEASFETMEPLSYQLSFNLNLSDPEYIEGINVQFEGVVGKQPTLQTSDGSFSCHQTTSQSKWECPTPGVRVASLDGVRVIFD